MRNGLIEKKKSRFVIVSIIAMFKLPFFILGDIWNTSAFQFYIFWLWKILRNLFYNRDI